MKGQPLKVRGRRRTERGGRRDRVEHEYPPADWTPKAIADTLDAGDPTAGLPTADDRDRWATLAADDLTGAVIDAILERAAADREKPIPPLPATHYLRWRREDDITQPEMRVPLNERLDRLSTFAIAECVEDDGTYLDDVLDYAWAVCEQSQWAYGPNPLSEDRELEGLPVDVPPSERRLVLRTVGIAKCLAEVDAVLGDRLHPALRRRIRDEVDERVFRVYEARDDLWWMSPPSNNWNAACNGQTMLAALRLLEDTDRLARLVADTAANMAHYLAGFDADGGTAEGVGYWNYGFGNYVQAAAALEARTDGAFSLFDPPIVEEIADFPLQVELSPGRFVPFSDTLEAGSIADYLAGYLGRRFDKRALAARGRAELAADPTPGRLSERLRALEWCQPVPAEWTQRAPAPRTYFDGMEWWLVRDDPAADDGLVVAAKGGHNDEQHNQNDCGSVVVHWRGESLVTDLGKPPDGYPVGYFDDDRYERFLLARSLGHSVPLINGIEQAPGREHAATVIDRIGGEDRESIVIELGDCYPAAAGVESVRRRVTLDRGAPGAVTIEDEVAFSGAAGTDATSVLVSYFPMAVEDGAVVITGDRGSARVTPSADPTVEHLEGAVAGRDVWRARVPCSLEDGLGRVSLSVSVGEA